MKVILSIIRVDNEYRAIVQVGENPEVPTEKKIILSLDEEVEDIEGYGGVKTREIIRELKEQAKKWARKEKIPFVANLDFDPYP